MEGNSKTIKRKGWLDLIRGILMCMVFLYHSEVFYGSGHSWSWLFEPIFLTGFFFVSGYLFASDWNRVTLKGKWLQTVRSILVPYFIFMAAFILPKLVLLHYDWKVSVSDILLLRASWFVIATGVIQIMYGLSFHINKSEGWIAACSIVYTAIGLIFALYLMRITGWRESSPILYSPAMPGCLPACINQAFLAVPFFTTGLFYRKYENKILIKPSYLLGGVFISLYIALIIINHRYIGGSINFASCVIDNSVMVYLLFAIAVVSFIAWSQKKDSLLCFNFIGKNSLLFYYFNVIMLRVVGKCYDKGLSLLPNKITEAWGGYYNEIIVAFIAIAFTFPIVWCINEYTPLLNGNKAAFQKWTNRLGLNIIW